MPIRLEVAAAIGIALFVAFAGLGLDDYLQRATVARLNRSLGQMQGAVTLQNDSINNYKGLADAAVKRAKAAQEASTRAHAGDAATIAALLAKPVETDPAKACAAADTLILETIK
jgi:hypothetical protein